MLKKSKRKSIEGRHNLDGMVREKIRQGILSGDLENGTHLSEIKISQQYGVSRTPVREALCALSADGLIEMFPNRGAFVKIPSDETRAQLTELHGFMFGLIARFVAEKVSDTDMARLERMSTAMGHVAGDTFEDYRWQINDMMRNLAGNDIISEMLGIIERRLPRPILPEVQTSQQATNIQQGYSYVMTAIKRRKPDTAEKAMRDVMQMSFDATPALEEAGAA